MDNRRRPQSQSQYQERVVVKKFEDPACPSRGVEVNGVPNRPLTWSRSFFCALPENRTGHFLRSTVRIENGVVVADMDGMLFARLLDEAQLFIVSACQAEADSDIERRQAQELKAMGQGLGFNKKGKPSPLGLSMTPEQRQARKHRHENNVAARRSSDQELRSKMRGK